jgi:CubicO group peptidase (beta-lactamase class C family)
MDSVVFRTVDVLAAGDYATGYVPGASGTTAVAPADSDCAWIRPAGFWWATASDVARFGALLADDGAGVLSPASVALLTAPLVATGANEPYGLGVTVWNDHAGRRLLHHGGALTGFSAFLAIAPDDDVAVALLWNVDGVDPGGTAIWILNKMLGLPDWVDTPYDAPPPAASTYGRYAGTFSDPYWLGDVVVRVEGDRLMAEFVAYATTAELIFPLEDTFIVDLPPNADPFLPTSATFFFDGAARVEYFASRWGVARVP